MSMRDKLLALPMLAAFAVTAFGQQPRTFESAPIREVPELELLVPDPPAAFRAGGRLSLCYELYITNMKDVQSTPKRVKVLGESGAVLLDSQGDELGRALIPAGKLGVSGGQPAPIRRGERVVFYAWVDLAKEAPVPKGLRHELTFQAANGGDSFTILGPDVPVLDRLRTIAPPVHGEDWLAGNGPSNTSFHRRGIVTLDGLSRVPQRFALDLVQIGADGETSTGDGKANASHRCYGQEVLAVADGVVSAVKDGIPENQPGVRSRAVPITYETVGGNHVILDIGGGLFANYAHLQPGKVRVKLGDRVKSGDVIGYVGNSGNSTEPHLHFHICDRNSPLGSQGMPYAIDRFVLKGRVTGPPTSPRIEWLKRPSERSGEIPTENEIIGFER